MLPCRWGDHTSYSGQAVSLCCPVIIISRNIPFPSLVPRTGYMITLERLQVTEG